jgi:serine/threonine protein kinase
MSHLDRERFGQYYLEKRLAMGGMAEIFRAQRVGAAGFVKDVVIKRIHPEFSEDTEFVRMFINEAKLVAMLRHPNIVQVLDFDQFDGIYYLAMELIEGINLKQLRLAAQKKQRPLPVQLALYIAIQALKGLSHAHNFSHHGQPLNIVHRDISPHNILVSFDGEVKVTDFGIARVQQQASMTAHGVLKGKASYMAPEQTHSSRVDHRADIFAMGVVAYELLCGDRLFAASNDVQLFEQVRNQPISPPHTRNPDISPEASEIIMWALHRDPRARIPDAQTFERRLQDCLSLRNPQEQLSLYVRALVQESPSSLHSAKPKKQPIPQKSRQTNRLDAVDSQQNAAEIDPPMHKALSVSDSHPAEAEAEAETASVDTEENFASSWDSFPMIELQDLSSPESASPPKKLSCPNDWMIKTSLAPLMQINQALPSNQTSHRQEPDNGDGDSNECADPLILSTVQVNPTEILGNLWSKPTPNPIQPPPHPCETIDDRFAYMQTIDSPHNLSPQNKLPPASPSALRPKAEDTIGDPQPIKLPPASPSALSPKAEDTIGDPQLINVISPDLSQEDEKLVLETVQIDPKYYLRDVDLPKTSDMSSSADALISPITPPNQLHTADTHKSVSSSSPDDIASPTSATRQFPWKSLYVVVLAIGLICFFLYLLISYITN